MEKPQRACVDVCFQLQVYPTTMTSDEQRFVVKKDFAFLLFPLYSH